MTTQEYGEMAGEPLGMTPFFAEHSRALPIWADTTKMERLLGPCKVSMREGVRRMVETSLAERVTRNHVIGEPAQARV